MCMEELRMVQDSWRPVLRIVLLHSWIRFILLEVGASITMPMVNRRHLRVVDFIGRIRHIVHQIYITLLSTARWHCIFPVIQEGDFPFAALSARKYVIIKP